MKRLSHIFQSHKQIVPTPKLDWPFLFRDDEINHLDEILVASQKGEVQTVMIRRKKVFEDTGEESNTDLRDQPISINGRGIGRTRLLTEWGRKLSSRRIKKLAIIDLINIRPKLESRTYKLSDLIISQTQRFFTIWNKEDITLLIKWILSRLVTVILITWIGIVAVITFLASVFTITPVLGIPGQAIIAFLMQYPLLITIAGLVALCISFVAYQSGSLQKVRRQWGKYLHPKKWREIITNKGSPQQIADMLSRCLRRDLTYVFLIDDFDYLDIAAYDVVLHISEMMKKNKYRGMFVISYNRDNPFLAESINSYLSSDLERNAPNKYFIDLPLLTEEQITTIVAKGFHDYNPALVNKAVKINHWLFGYTDQNRTPIIINGRCDLVVGFFEYLVGQNFITGDKESSPTVVVSEENVGNLFEQFLSKSHEQYRKLSDHLQQIPNGNDCLELLRWLLAIQWAKIKTDELHALSKMSRSTVNICLDVLRRNGVINEHRSGFCELDPEWRILLKNQWLDWNVGNSYTRQVFEYILSHKNLDEQENIEEQALLAGPSTEAIEILVQKATYLSDDLGYIPKSLRYFEAALEQWKQLLLLNIEKSPSNKHKIASWQTRTNYHPGISTFKENHPRDVKPISLCHTIALICVRTGNYKRAHEVLIKEWPTIHNSLSDLSLTSIWAEVESVAQKLQILNARLLLREGRWSDSIEMILDLRESPLSEIAHAASILELSLKNNLIFGIEHLARQFYVPKMIDSLHKLANVYLSDQTDPISYANGLMLDIQFALNNYLVAFMKQESESDTFSFYDTYDRLSDGMDTLFLALKASTSRYSDFEILRGALGILKIFNVLVNLCHALVNIDSEHIKRINVNEINKVLFKLVNIETPRMRDILFPDLLHFVQEDHDLLNHYMSLDLNNIESSELVAVAKQITPILGKFFNQGESAVLDRITRLAEYLGCQDNLPELIAMKYVQRMQSMADLPKDAPDRESAVVEIANGLGKALKIADGIGRVDGSEKICVALGAIYDEFLLHYSRAAEFYERAAFVCHTLGMPHIQNGSLFMHAAVNYHNNMILYQEQSDILYVKERKCLEQARQHFLLASKEEDYARIHGDYLRTSIIRLDFELANYSLRDNDFTQALYFADDVLARIDDPVSDTERDQKGNALFLKGRILTASRNIGKALEALEQAHQIFKEHDTFHEIQVLETLVDITSPLHRQIQSDFNQLAQLRKNAPETRMQMLPDWLSVLSHRSQGDYSGIYGLGMPTMMMVQTDPVLDGKWEQYFSLLSERYNEILSKGVDILPSEFRLEMAQVAIGIAVSAQLPDIRHFRDAFYLYCGVGEAQKAFGVLKVFLSQLAAIPQTVLPHLGKPYSRDDFLKDANALLRSLKEDNKETVEIAANVYMLLKLVKGEQMHVDSEKRNSFIQAKGLREAGKTDEAISILSPLAANAYQDANLGTLDEPRIPSDIDLSIFGELYELLSSGGLPDQATDIDKQRHYLDAIKTSSSLLKLGQEYEQINPQIALQLFKMALNAKIETIYSQASRQKYYHLEEQWTTPKPEMIEPNRYAVEADPEYFVFMARKTGDQFFSSEHYEEAINHYKEGYNFCIKSNNKSQQIYFLVQLGVCFMNLKQFPEAIQSFNSCIELCKGSNYFISGLAIAESNLGSVYSLQNKNAEAKSHYEEALEAFDKMHDEKGIAYIKDRIQELEHKE